MKITSAAKPPSPRGGMMKRKQQGSRCRRTVSVAPTKKLHFHSDGLSTNSVSSFFFFFFYVLKIVKLYLEFTGAFLDL